MPNDDPPLQSFWPAQRIQPGTKLPIAFCHVEGEEEASAIKTSHSNEQSKANMQEVRKVVGVMCDGLQISILKLCAMINDRYNYVERVSNDANATRLSLNYLKIFSFCIKTETLNNTLIR